jgi:hypothetical protein
MYIKRNIVIVAGVRLQRVCAACLVATRAKAKT